MPEEALANLPAATLNSLLNRTDVTTDNVAASGQGVVLIPPRVLRALLQAVALDAPIETLLANGTISGSTDTQEIFLDFVALLGALGNGTTVEVECAAGCQVVEAGDEVDPDRLLRRRRGLLQAAAPSDAPGGVTVDLTCGENVLNATVSSAQADAAQSFTFFIVRECDDEPEPGPEARPPPEVPAANRTANGTGEEGVTVEEERPARGAPGIMTVGVAAGAVGLLAVLASAGFAAYRLRYGRAPGPGGDDDDDKFASNAFVAGAAAGGRGPFPSAAHYRSMFVAPPPGERDARPCPAYNPVLTLVSHLAGGKLAQNAFLMMPASGRLQLEIGGNDGDRGERAAPASPPAFMSHRLGQLDATTTATTTPTAVGGGLHLAPAGPGSSGSVASPSASEESPVRDSIRKFQLQAGAEVGEDPFALFRAKQKRKAALQEERG